MPHKSIQIQTEDGLCPAHILHPAGPGPWPGVLMLMDGIGMRPAIVEMGERLANAGYYVLLPDLFYRIGSVSMDAKKLFSDPETQKEWFAKILPVASAANMMRDMPAFLDHLAAQPNVKQPKFGTTGYCMGGRIAFVAAGHFPNRFAAAASYHPSGLATDAPDSPHLLAPKMKARVYVGGAIEDRGFDDAQKARLDRALSDAGVDHVIETYQARHGWVPSDTPVHDPVATERHWETLLDLFGKTL